MTLHKRLAATMSKKQKRRHVDSLRTNARLLRSNGHEKAAQNLERGADEFEVEHGLTNKKEVEWLR